MDSVKQTIAEISVRQCELVGGDPARGVRLRVVRSDGSPIGEFTLTPGDDGWLPIPVPGAPHPGLLHSTAIDFTREVNEGRIQLD
jgi:hypothetical protein